MELLSTKISQFTKDKKFLDDTEQTNRLQEMWELALKYEKQAKNISFQPPVSGSLPPTDEPEILGHFKYDYEKETETYTPVKRQ